MVNDILHKFWELEEHPRSNPLMSQEEREVLKHFQARKQVPLPRMQNPLESLVHKQWEDWKNQPLMQLYESTST